MQDGKDLCNPDAWWLWDGTGNFHRDLFTYVTTRENPNTAPLPEVVILLNGVKQISCFIFISSPPSRLPVSFSSGDRIGAASSIREEVT